MGQWHQLLNHTSSSLAANGIIQSTQLRDVSRAVRQDRLWFQRNPSAIVRFRTTSEGEFDPLHAVGEQPPIFKPSICRANAPLRWVAVVDLMRLAGEQSVDAATPTMRVRMRIPAIHSSKRREKVEKELLNAIAAELLDAIDQENNPIAA